MTLGPVEASVVCPRCGNEVKTSEFENHLRGHGGKAFTSFDPPGDAVPVGRDRLLQGPDEVPVGRNRFPRGPALAERRGVGLARRAYTAGVGFRSYLDTQTGLVRTVGPGMVPCPLGKCRAIIVREMIREHVLDTVVWRDHAISMPDGKWEEFLQLVRVRPDRAIAALVEKLEKRGFKVSRSDGKGPPCPECGAEVLEGAAIEYVGRKWRHLLCPSFFAEDPAPGGVA